LRQEISFLRQDLIENELLVGKMDVKVTDLDKENFKERQADFQAASQSWWSNSFFL